MEKSGKERFSALREINEAINFKRKPQEILDLIVQVITSILGVSGSSVLVREEEDGKLKSIASSGLSDDFLSKGLTTADKSLDETFKGKTVLILGAAEKEGIGPILSLPIHVNQKVIGAFRVYAPEGYEFSKETIDFVEILGEQASFAIQNALLYQIFEDYRETMMTHIWRSFNSKARMPKLDFKAFQTPSQTRWQARL